VVIVDEQQASAENFYEILRVPVDASTEAIRKAWRLAAWENHPDLQGSETEPQRRAHEMVMQRINEAYQTLSDPAKRRRYDLETGLLGAQCSRCGKDGNLRLGGNGNVVALCGDCYRVAG
jgi:DnaJ-class molecular chaperone